MTQPPNEIPETGLDKAAKREFNRMVRYVRSLRPIQNDTVQIEHTVNGVSIRAKGGGSSSSTSTVPVWG